MQEKSYSHSNKTFAVLIFFVRLNRVHSPSNTHPFVVRSRILEHQPSNTNTGTDDLSYVCDVNGWSMVKTSPKYWDDCSHILTEIILQTIDPSRLERRKKRSESDSHKSSASSSKILNKPASLKRTPSTMQAELRCVVGVFRHGDRTPKQKMKMKTSHVSILSMFHRYCNKKFGRGVKSEYHRRTRNDNSATVMNSKTSGIYEREVLLRTAAELQDVLDMARSLLRDIRVAEDESDNSECELPVAKLTQLKTVLEMYGGFKGINRKVQLKPKKWSFEKDKNGIPRRVATEVLLVRKCSSVCRPTIHFHNSEHNHSRYRRISKGTRIRVCRSMV